MPLYELKCNKCGNIFEQLVFPSDGENKFICPRCGEGDTHRLMSSFSSRSSISGKGLSNGVSSACPPSPGGFT